MSSFRHAMGIFVLLALPAIGWADPLTFICVSDTHWKIPDEQNDRKRQIVASMNDIAGKKFPASLKEVTLGKPVGVLVAGDLIDGGRESQTLWTNWQRDFGLTGTDGAVLKLPVYETWGNHDGGKIVAEGIVARNKKRVGPISISPENNGEGLNYSWDWGQLHLVTVGFYPGNAVESKKHRSPNYDPRHSLDFLIKDLQTNVGDSKRPVIIMQHANLPNDSDEWWTAEQRTAYYEAFKNYNVVAIVDGHEGGGLYKWQGIDILGCNDIQSGYWVVQIDGTQMLAARTTDGVSWVKNTLNKTIELGKPRAAEKPATTAPAEATPKKDSAPAAPEATTGTPAGVKG